jgi:hypothetical protein
MKDQVLQERRASPRSLSDSRKYSARHHFLDMQKPRRGINIILTCLLIFPRITSRHSPTIPHCSMATLIGLSLRVKLLRSLPSRFRISVQIEPGAHASEIGINKQLRDKERVCAALENKHLVGVVNKCIRNGANP